MKFEELGLAETLLRAIDAQGYDAPTPIQTAAIPPVLEGRDVLGCAQTGTGKTAAFALPILQRLRRAECRVNGRGRKIRTLILAPTRELTLQIGESFQAYGRYTKIRCTTIFGGVNQSPQVRALNAGVDIVVATPGRLLDLMQQGFVDLSHVEVLVLDEADRMLDMGFIHDLRRIVAKVPRKRQTLLFSATMPAAIRQLAAQWLDHPVDVRVGPQSTTVETIRQSVFFVDQGQEAASAHALAAKDGLAADARLHAHQARRRQSGEMSGKGRHRGRRLPQQQESIGPAAGACRDSSRRVRWSWWPPTLRLADSTST